MLFFQLWCGPCSFSKNNSPKTTFVKPYLVQFAKIVKNSLTKKQVVQKCGYKCLTNYRGIDRRIEKLKLDTSHFDPNHNNSVPKNKKKLKDVCVENSTFDRGSLKKRLFSELNWKKICCNCQATECISIETGEVIPIPIELDHINGVNNDHRFENLRFLCPNCHTQMPTNKGSNVKNKQQTTCTDCNKKITKGSTRCGSCASKKFNKRKVKNRPSLETLLEDLKTLPYTKVGKKYGVSDNCIRKWIKQYKKNA